MNFIIYYQKWALNEYKKLNKSIKDILNMDSLQFYMPFYSLYFYIHNTAKAFKKIDLKRNFYLKEVIEITKSRYYNSNMFLKGKIYNECKNTTEERELFCKSIPILDPIHVVNNNYNLVNHNNYHLPSNYNYNTFSKINDINNTAYIDVFCSYLFGNLTYNNINPSFPIYYGSMNGIGDYNYDITEDYDDIKYDKAFNENIDKGFKLEIYISDSDSDSDSEEDEKADSLSRTSREFINSKTSRTSRESRESKSSRISRESKSSRISRESKSSRDSKTSTSSRSFLSEDSYSDCIAKLKKIPIQLLFIEKLEGTLEDLLDEDIKEEVLLSCIFQISYALTYLQKHFKFTHNDLHINNVMYIKTEKIYLYYKYNNIYYRVPTHGYIFKIIDFGRAIFTFKNKVFMNDVFSDHGEAGGQYTYPNQLLYKKRDVKVVNPNYHFDLCRLSMTILQELNSKNYSDNTLLLLNKMCTNNQGINFCDMDDNFYLYKSIARDACNCLPREIILNDIFKSYRIKKKLFPRKSYYTL